MSDSYTTLVFLSEMFHLRQRKKEEIERERKEKK